MSAPITKQHLKIIDEIRVGDRSMRFDITDAQAAQLIADSEAKAVAEWQDFVHLKGEAIDSLLLECDRLRAECNNLRADLDAIKAIRDEEKARAERAEAELATERARLDAMVANCWVVHSEVGGSFSVFSNTCGDYIATAQTYRAAIDAAMKEGA